MHDACRIVLLKLSYCYYSRPEELLILTMYILPVLLVFVSNTQASQDQDLNGLYEATHGVKVNKCCENDQLMVDSSCISNNTVNQSKYNFKKIEVNVLYDS